VFKLVQALEDVAQREPNQGAAAMAAAIAEYFRTPD
jgi:hypothetical protein